MYALGIDIGTTSLSAVVLDAQTLRAVHTASAAETGFLTCAKPYERIQDPISIWEQVQKLVQTLEKEYDLSAIGLTGQMHGILYIGLNGEPLSPLYTWQDGSSAQPFMDGKSYAEILSGKTGLPIRPGYGAATYFCHLKQNHVPSGTRYISTIHSWIAMKLCGNSKPILHTSDAAGIGMYLLEKERFDLESIRSNGMKPSFFPDIFKASICGYYNGKIPVSIAIGDNQASFLGAVRKPEDSVLVNIGTGSQISFQIPFLRESSCGEIRPSADGQYLAVGASLCGGRAYAILERFFRQTLEMAGAPTHNNLYRQMEAAARTAAPPFMQFSTLFCGTRETPSQRASIQGIDENNFTPGNLTVAALYGIAQELFEMYQKMAGNSFSPCRLIGSGNGFRKNPLLQKRLGDIFHLPIEESPYQEEAASGAAIFALRCCQSAQKQEDSR